MQDATWNVTRLQRMKRFATGLLLLMVTLFVLSAIYGPAHPSLRWVEAFAEAATVGALADWFAVTALFRHPLGLPIPHTAIIPKNKDEIGVSMGQFVEQNFLTPANVIRKLEQRNLALAVTEWLAEPGRVEALAHRIGAQIPLLFEKLEDEDVQRFLDHAVVPHLRTLDLSRAFGATLDLLTLEGGHQAFLDRALAALDAWLTSHRELIRTKVSEASKFTPAFFDYFVADRFVDGLLRLIHEVAREPSHEIRVRFDRATREFIDKLKTSPAYRAQGEKLRDELLAHVRNEEYYKRLWAALKGRIVSDLDTGQSLIRQQIVDALLATADTLRADCGLQRKLNTWTLRALERLMLRHRHEVSLLISEIVRAWDTEEVSQRVEREIGKDLQFIRINGTLVGGMAGLLLHAAIQFVT